MRWYILPLAVPDNRPDGVVRRRIGEESPNTGFVKTS